MANIDLAKLPKPMDGLLSRSSSAVWETNSRLLALLAEIWLQIYGFLFSDGKHILGSRGTDRAMIKDKPDPSQDHSTVRHQILLTCRICYTEARQLFYSISAWNVRGFYRRFEGSGGYLEAKHFGPNFLAGEREFQQSKWITNLSLRGVAEWHYLIGSQIVIFTSKLPSLSVLTLTASCRLCQDPALFNCNAMSDDRLLEAEKQI